jgi:CDP-glucose 4,6-dehydratase
MGKLHGGFGKMDLSFYKGKRIFITGHTGFKGTWLSKILILAGAEVTGYAIEPSEDKILFHTSKIETDLHSILGDVRDLNSLRKAVKEAKPEIIIHMAAQPLVRVSYQNPVETYEINVMGTVNILESMREVNSTKSFLNVTTDKVYENNERFDGYKEHEKLCGYDPYSNSKSCSELVTYSYKNSFFKGNDASAISTARSGNVIGGGDFSKDRIMPDCIRSSIQHQNIVLRNPFSIRPYQHVLDCLCGYLTLTKMQYENKTIEGNYNFGPEDEDYVTTGELADIFCKAWSEEQSWVNSGATGPHEAGILKLDNQKSKKMLYWQPKMDIETAVRKTIEWAKVYYDDGEIEKCMVHQIKDYFDSSK